MFISKHLLNLILTVIITYILFAFISASVNPFDWNMWARLGMVALACFIFIFVVAVTDKKDE